MVECGQAATPWVWYSHLDFGESNCHHQNRDGEVLYSFCIGPCSSESVGFSNPPDFAPSFPYVRNTSQYQTMTCCGVLGQAEYSFYRNALDLTYNEAQGRAPIRLS